MLRRKAIPWKTYLVTDEQITGHPCKIFPFENYDCNLLSGENLENVKKKNVNEKYEMFLV